MPAAMNGMFDELQRDHDDARNAEQHEVGDDEQRDAEIAARRMMVEVVLEPVVRRALRVLLERFAVARGDAIELGAFEQHALQAEQARAVRIAVLLAMSVMLAVHGHPLARRGAGVQPQPEAAEVADDGMQVDGAVRLVAMVVERHGHHRARASRAA